ncbi:MAG: hypothetical protein NTW28_13240 [Candidatus Solibacter sp.]|nr:hypothetical protein [Candidatus Solibacter sp.]
MSSLIGLLEEIQKPLTAPILRRVKLHPQAPLDELFNYQKHCVQVGMWVVAELAVYDSDIEVLKDFSRRAFGPGTHWTYRIEGKSISVEKLPVLSQALVENHLHGWTGWQNADDPQAWIARVARDIANQRAWEEAPLAVRQRHADGTEDVVPAVPLDEIAETPAESSEHGVTVERVYDFGALRDEALRRGDLDLAAYIDGMEAAATQTWDARAAHRQTRARLGWNKFKASDVRMRFQRLRDAAAVYVTRGHPAVSDASRNTFFETFYDGHRGLPHGEWKHKPPK